MNKQCEQFEIVLSGDGAERLKALKVNKSLLVIHVLLIPVIFLIFLNIAIKDPSYIDAYTTSAITFIIGMAAWLFAAFFLASVIMWLPAALLAKTIRPEIMICDSAIIYLAGSTSLNYIGLSIAVYPSFKYLLGYESSQRLQRDEVLSVDIESARFMKPGFGFGKQIVIKHKYGQINTGIWLDVNEKKRIADRLKKWAQLSS